jgi:hypothetical protein
MFHMQSRDLKSDLAIRREDNGGELRSFFNSCEPDTHRKVSEDEASNHYSALIWGTMWSDSSLGIIVSNEYRDWDCLPEMPFEKPSDQVSAQTKAEKELPRASLKKLMIVNLIPICFVLFFKLFYDDSLNV